MVAITAEKFALQADKERLQAALAGLTQQLQQLQSDAKLTESLNRKEKQERRALEAELWSLAQELKGTDRTHHQQREELQQRAGRQKEALEAEIKRVAQQDSLVEGYLNTMLRPTSDTKKGNVKNSPVGSDLEVPCTLYPVPAVPCGV